MSRGRRGGVTPVPSRFERNPRKTLLGLGAALVLTLAVVEYALERDLTRSRCAAHATCA